MLSVNLFECVKISLISAYELWFKQILFEMDIVSKLFVANLWVCIRIIFLLYFNK